MLRKIGYLLLVVGLVAVGALPVAAQNEIPIQAEITSAGSAPLVKAVWTGRDDNEDYLVEDDDLARLGSQVIPNADPNVTRVYVWAVVADPNGVDDVADVFFDIYEPPTHCANPSQFKVQVHMTDLGNGHADAVQEAADLGLIWYNFYPQDWPDPDKAGNEVTLADLLWELDPTKNQAHLWYGYFEYVPCTQHPGYYQADVYGVDAGGAIDYYSGEVEIASIVALEIDFATVNWGEVKPGLRRWIAGDENMATPYQPTLLNRGNEPGRIRVETTPLASQGLPVTKYITKFDAALLNDSLQWTSTTPNVFNGKWFLADVGEGLPHCDPTQIEFSVLADLGLPAAVYTGTMRISIDHANGFPMYCP
jgi:hypothetical protein